MRIMRDKNELVLIYIALFDIILLIINSIYHFIIHGFYKTTLGIIFLILIGLSFLIGIVFGPDRNKLLNDISTLGIAALSIFVSCFLLYILIKSIIVSRPIFLIIQWLIPIIVLIILCIKEDL